MRVLIADKLPDRARVRLAAGGCEVRLEANLKGDALIAAMAEFRPEALIVRSTRVTAAHVAASPDLALVVRAGAGVNTIDLDACSLRGVYVSNCPGKNAVAVAELTMGLVLALDRRLADNVADLRAGRWDKGRYSKAEGLKGRTLGLLGMGLIGQAVARRAQAFGMEVLAWSRSLTDESAAEHGVRRYDTPEDVARRSHVLSVHLALTPETRGFVGDSIFRELRSDAIFVNTSRAEIVDHEALHRALHRGIRAGLDVFPDEPDGKDGPFDSPLGKHPNVYGTHHIGASTEQAQEAVADEACRVVEQFRDRGEVPNCVNLAERSAADHVLVVRHEDRVGVLAGVLEALRKAHLNVQEMANIVFAGGGAAVARIAVKGAPPPETLEALTSRPDVFAISVVPIASRS